MRDLPISWIWASPMTYFVQGRKKQKDLFRDLALFHFLS